MEIKAWMETSSAGNQGHNKIQLSFSKVFHPLISPYVQTFLYDLYLKLIYHQKISKQ